MKERGEAETVNAVVDVIQYARYANQAISARLAPQLEACLVPHRHPSSAHSGAAENNLSEPLHHMHGLARVGNVGLIAQCVVYVPRVAEQVAARRGEERMEADDARSEVLW